MAWTFDICDRDTLALKANVHNARDREFDQILNRPSTAKFKVSINDELFTTIPRLLDEINNYALVIRKDDKLIWSGILFDWDVDLSEGTYSITFTAKDWVHFFNYRLTTEDLRYTQIEQGEIMADLLDRAQKGSAINLDGSQQFLNVGKVDNDRLVPPNEFTIGGWMQIDTLPAGGAAGQMRVARKAHNDTRSWEFIVRGDGSVAFAVNNASNVQTILSAPAATVAGAGAIYSVFCVWKNTGYMAIYINGMVVASSTTGPTALRRSTEDVVFGTRNGDVTFYEFFDGKLDDWFILDEALVEPDALAADLALTFNGDDVIKSDDTPLIDIGTGDFSIEGWFKLDAAAPSALIYCGIGDRNNGYGYGGGCYISKDSTGVYFIVDDGANYRSRYFATTTLGTGWHHYCITRTGLTVAGYIDGVAATGGGSFGSSVPSASGTLSFSENAFMVGWKERPGDYQSFQGLANEVRLYSRALTSAEVTNHYNGGNGRYGNVEAGLVVLWHLDEGAKNSPTGYAHQIQDHSGNNIFGNYGETFVTQATANPVYVTSHIPPSRPPHALHFSTSPMDYYGDALMAFWRFDAATADMTFDYSGYGNHLKLVNKPEFIVGIKGYIDEYDMGVRRGTIANSGILRDREYDLKNITEAWQQMSEVRNGPDFEITPERMLNIYYPYKGSDKSYLVFEWGINLQSSGVDASTTEIVNQAIGQGQGASATGETGTTAAAAIDLTSMRAHKLRQKVVQAPDVSRETTLDEYVSEEIRSNAYQRRVYSFKGIPGMLPAFGSYLVGDLCRLVIKKGPINEDTTFRVNAMKVKLTDTGAEDVDITFASL